MFHVELQTIHSRFHTHGVEILNSFFFFWSFICSCSFVVDADLLFTVISKNEQICRRLRVVFYKEFNLLGGGIEGRVQLFLRKCGTVPGKPFVSRTIKTIVKKWCKDDLSEAEAQVPSEGSTLIEFLQETYALALPVSRYQDLGWGLKKVSIDYITGIASVKQKSEKYFIVFYLGKEMNLIAFCTINWAQQTHCLNKKRSSELNQHGFYSSSWKGWFRF